jgi:phosphoribosylformylglycinamidine cyclo-ligase
VLLTPTRLYVRDVLDLIDAAVPLHAVAHITGGGLPENLPRALPDGLEAVVDPTRWRLPQALQAVLDSGRVAETDAWDTFNMGIGLCMVTPPDAADAVLARIPDARMIGLVAPGCTGVRRV